MDKKGILKTLLILFAFTALWSCASVKSGQAPAVSVKTGTNVSIGKENSVSPGDVIFSEWNYQAVNAAFTTAAFERQIGFGSFSVPMGLALTKGSVDGQEAYCSQVPVFTGPGESYRGCFFDSKNSRILDKAYLLGTLKSFVFDVSVPYKVEERIFNGGGAAGFKCELVYEGVNAQTIKVAYREYIDSMARPAFQQDLSYNLNVGSATEVSFKGAKLTIYQANNNEIRYVVNQGFRK